MITYDNRTLLQQQVAFYIFLYSIYSHSGCRGVETLRIPMEMTIHPIGSAKGPNRVARTPCVVSEPRNMRGITAEVHPSHVMFLSLEKHLHCSKQLETMDLNKLVTLGRGSPT